MELVYLERPILRRQDACVYICVCGNETGNSCKLCSNCHQISKNDLRENKIRCTYKYCVNSFEKESNKK